MTFLRRLLKMISFALGDRYYNICVSRDAKLLRDEFRRILTNSSRFLYLCQTSNKPLMLRDEYRDMILNKIWTKTSALDMKILIRPDLFRSLNYYDASFHTTGKRIGDFVIGDAGCLYIAPHNWHLVKAREAYPGEDLRATFLQAYNKAGEQG